MELINNIWREVCKIQILENNLNDLFLSISIILFGLLLKRFISVLFSRIAYIFIKKSSNNIPTKEFVDLLKPPLEFFLMVSLIYTAAHFLHFPESWHLVSARRFGVKMVVYRGFKFIYIIAFIWIIFRVIDFFALVLQKNAIETGSKIQEQLVPFLKQLVKLLVFIISFFAILGIVFKLNVGAIITGLGISGVAVALAGKETLENLLASFSIFIDKPFIAGDLIQIGNVIGNVETVGFRTTKIRTLDKSLVSIPNKQLIDQPLENLSHREQHRAKFSIEITYRTEPQKIKVLTEEIKEIIIFHSKTESEPLVFLEQLGKYSFELTVIYLINVVKFEDFWHIKEEINYGIYQKITENEIDIAYPTSIVINEHLGKPMASF
jgi:MscS family membrane protein